MRKVLKNLEKNYNKLFKTLGKIYCNFMDCFRNKL